MELGYCTVDIINPNITDKIPFINASIFSSQLERGIGLPKEHRFHFYVILIHARI